MIDKAETIDIRGIVASSRASRPQMVQTLKQYVFIHSAAEVMITKELAKRKKNGDSSPELKKSSRRKRRISAFSIQNTDESTTAPKKSNRDSIYISMPINLIDSGEDSKDK